ncbi:MAG: hypothetical protein ABJB34_03250, partial [Acidobacteriota bacterium]
MDKRFLLALVLTAVVVIATPWLFGTQSSLVPTKAGSGILKPDSTKRGDSLARTAAIERDTSRPTITSSSVPDSNPAMMVAETTVVSTPLANYRFSSVGAMPLSVELKSYKALDGSKQNVRLASASNHLVSYRLFLPGDTVALSGVPFTLDKSRTAAG